MALDAETLKQYFPRVNSADTANAITFKWRL